jgi:aspartyl-tRNA(Asn)/glutamyl-tRNA(Gln) amidotransferase subunit A
VGFGISAYDYLQALRLRAKLTRAFVREVSQRLDVLAHARDPRVAGAWPRWKTVTVDGSTSRRRRFSRRGRSTAWGCPAISVPCGFSGSGLPLGFQAVGRPFDEASVEAGHDEEAAGGTHTVSRLKSASASPLAARSTYRSAPRGIQLTLSHVG